MSFTIQSKPSGNVDVVRISGRLVLGYGTAGLRASIAESVQRKAHVLADLSGVTYVDSAGLGELVASLDAVKARGRAMKLLRPADRVDSLLHITKLYSTFEVFENEGAALASFANM